MTTALVVVASLLVIWLLIGAAICWRIGLAHIADSELRDWVLGCLVMPAVVLAAWWTRVHEHPKVWDLFLCYSHRDCLWASAVFGIMRSSEATVFLDFVVIERGSDWRKRAREAIQRSDVLVFLSSREAVRSPHVQFELAFRKRALAGTSREWRERGVWDSSFPSELLKALPSYEGRRGVLTIPIPGSPRPDWKYESRADFASRSVANVEDWLAVNLPQVEQLAGEFGLPVPPREKLAGLMREYLEWAAGGRQPLTPAQERESGHSLRKAAKVNDAEVIRRKIEEGIDPDYRVGDDDTPLVLAVYEGHLDAVRALIRAGADLDARASRGRTALMLAIEKGHSKLAYELISRGADRNLADQHGVTALIWAAKLGRTEIARRLLAAGVDTNAVDAEGNSALEYATRRNHWEIQRLLSDQGGEPSAADSLQSQPK